MKRVLIGIVGRRERNHDKPPMWGNVIAYDYMKPLDDLCVNYIGLITNKNYDNIDEDIVALCDGILFPGGDEMKSYHHNIVQYCYENKIPMLGICLGFQTIASYFAKDKVIGKVSLMSMVNHNPLILSEDMRKDSVHDVILDSESTLGKMFAEKIMVNSRHNYAITRIDEPLRKVGVSSDGIIEAFEYINDDEFIVGVQWHPENQTEDMMPLFERFVEYAQKNKDRKEQM